MSTLPSSSNSQSTSGIPAHGKLLAAGAGLASVVAGLGVAELAAAVVDADASPITVVGSLVIDLSPGWLKEFVISLVGAADKPAIIATVAIAALVLGALAGVLEFVRPPFGRVLLGVLALICAGAAISRAGASLTGIVPAAVALVVAGLLLNFLLKKMRGQTAPYIRMAPDIASRRADLARRQFLIYSGASVLVGIGIGLLGRTLSAGTRAAEAARAAFRLPAPATPAAPIPAAASLAVNGISPVITPNKDFYRVDTALQVPGLDQNDWQLKITGMVENEVTISFAELIALPLVESTITLACVSNPVGGDLIGNATWLGYPIRKLLARAVPHSDADMVLSRSSDGFTASTPIDVLTDDRDALLAVGMNGMPLPLEHGYPVRMVVPGLYGYVSATKWVVELKVTRFDLETAYWTENGWSERGPVKTESRIDVPRSDAGLKAGKVAVAGVAWAQHTGIKAVQVQVDDGPWHEARLAKAISNDTWVQWVWEWPATSGKHVLSVRATDKSGYTQTSDYVGTVPNGATGWDQVSVNVS